MKSEEFVDGTSLNFSLFTITSYLKQRIFLVLYFTPFSPTTMKIKGLD